MPKNSRGGSASRSCASSTALVAVPSATRPSATRRAPTALSWPASTAPAGSEQLAKYGSDVVIVWDPEDPASDIVFKAGYLTAKALSMRAAARSSAEAASFQKIDKAIEVIRKQMGGFDEMKTTSETIHNGSNKLLDRIRIMRGELEKQVEILADQVDGLKDAE